MKVLIAISSSFSAHFIAGQAEYLQQKGCQPMIVSGPGKEVAELGRDENVEIKYIDFKREISLVSDIRSYIEIIKLIRAEKPDIINAGNPKTGFLFSLAKVFFPRLPIIFTLRGMRSDTLYGFKKRVVKFTEYVSCLFADKVIVVSPSLKEHAVKSGILKEEKSIVIGKGSSNGINIEKYTVTDDKQKAAKDFRQSLGIQDHDFAIGFVGRITKDKGVTELYNSFKLVRNQQENIKLIIVGPKEEGDPIPPETYLEMEKDPDVYLLGQLKNLENIYPAFDIFVLYSHREGFGNVVLEASCMERPTIVANIPGLRDTTEHMKTGLVVAPINEKALENAINFYIENPEHKQLHGQQGYERVTREFASEVIWQEQYNIYKRLTSKAKKKKTKLSEIK